jgi:biopolymer transport protein ExbD
MIYRTEEEMPGTDFKAASNSQMLNFRNFSIIAAFVILAAVLAIGIIPQKRRIAGPIVILPAFKNQFSTKPPQGHAIVITATLNATLEDKVFLNTTLISIEELPQKLNLLRKTNAKAPLYLKIDQRLPLGIAIRIWQFVRTERWEIVSLVVKGRDSFDQRILKVGFGLPDPLPDQLRSMP